MKSYTLALFFSLAGAVGLLAQPESSETQLWLTHPRLTIFGNADIALTSANMTGLPGIPSCCPEYSSAVDIGMLGGLGYIAPLDQTFALHVRMHYWSFGSSLKDTETLPVVDLDGGPSAATIEHTLNGTFQQISIEPLLGYKLTGGLSALGGLTLGGAFSTEYDQKETLVTPVDGTFQNKSRERNVLNGSIPNPNVFQAGVTVGLTYDLPLNADGSLVISPEVLFTYSVLPHAQNVSWNTHHLRAGLAIGFVPPQVEDSLTDVELYEFTKTVTPPSAIAPGIPFVANVSHSGITETGSVTNGETIRIEEFASTRVRPLLPYVFFKPGANNLDAKYRRLNDDQVKAFSMANFYNLDAIVTYGHLLNIIGRRMTDDPQSTITLTGCADPAEGASANAQERAQAVKEYLTGTWGISADRIGVTTRGIPERASRSAEPDGLAENARVEITASTNDILAPVESTDTMLVTTPSGIRFAPSIDPRVHIAGYTLFIAHDGKLLKTITGSDPLPSGIDWRISETAPWIPNDATNISYLLAVRDSSGAVVPSTTHNIPVERVRSSGHDKLLRSDIRLDRYSLILFGFDQDALTPEHQTMVSMIKQRIQPKSSVKVIGYTDRTGDASYNQSLSERRARSVARALGQQESVASGRGETLPLYDNTTPEGRFYSRTVEVLVETPNN